MAIKQQTLTCARCGYTFASTVVRKCPHEAVNRLLGEHICIYCCKKCKFHTKQPFCGAVGCSLWRKEEDTNDTKRTTRKR